MLPDFELILVLATAITGVVWAWDRTRRGTRAGGAADNDDAGSDAAAKEPWWLDLSRSLFPVLLVVLVIRSFMIEPFRIPSGSMIPTLLPGDFIAVNKAAYGFRLPVVHTRIFGDWDPERGDVAVFRYPRDPSQDYIKRIVGLPGDRLRYVDKQLYINGEPVPQEILGPYPGAALAQLREEVIGDVSHRILVFPGVPDRGIAVEVPPGEYFVMGDNRDRSSDSRYWGTVPESHLVGEAFLIWMSWNGEENTLNWSRIGDTIE